MSEKRNNNEREGLSDVNEYKEAVLSTAPLSRRISYTPNMNPPL